MSAGNFASITCWNLNQSQSAISRVAWRSCDCRVPALLTQEGWTTAQHSTGKQERIKTGSRVKRLLHHIIMSNASKKEEKKAKKVLEDGVVSEVAVKGV